MSVGSFMRKKVTQATAPNPNKVQISPERMGQATNATPNTPQFAPVFNPPQGGHVMPSSGSPETDSFYKYLKQGMEDARAAAEARAKTLYGDGNLKIKEIEDTRRQRALGLNGDEIRMMRERGNAGINSTMATGLRQLRGLQAGSGVRGGAAAAGAIPVLQNAVSQRSGLERDIALADMQRRGQELDKLESTVTGERAGGLSYELGNVMLDSTNRSNAAAEIRARDMLDIYRNAIPGRMMTPEEAAIFERTVVPDYKSGVDKMGSYMGGGNNTPTQVGTGIGRGVGAIPTMWGGNAWWS